MVRVCVTPTHLLFACISIVFRVPLSISFELRQMLQEGWKAEVECLSAQGMGGLEAFVQSKTRL